MSENLRVKSSNFIDETTRVSFKFNTKTYHGFKGTEAETEGQYQRADGSL